MKRKAASLVLIFLLFSSATGQDHKAPEGNMKRDFPKVELIRPTIPPQYYNFQLHRWEQRADSMGIEVETKTQEFSDILTAPKQRVRKGKVQRRKRTSNNDMHRSRRAQFLCIESLPHGGPVMSSVRPLRTGCASLSPPKTP